MYKKPKYQNKVNGQTIRVFDSWKAAHSERHFIVITRIGREYGTITREKAYPNEAAAMAKIEGIENWLQRNQI